MVVVTNYRVMGRITKPNFRTTFQKEVRALKPEHAIEQVYKILGSKHRVKRFHIIIERVEEISVEESSRISDLDQAEE